jgi:four helix bundle protein
MSTVKPEGSETPRRDLPERTFEFARRVVVACLRREKPTAVSRPIWSQLLRSATSIGANIEEGQGSHSRADFAAKYSIACKEAREAHYWLRLLVATEIASPATLRPLIDEASELIAILTTIVRKAKQAKPETGKSEE